MQSWFPVLENNQGFFSILALIAALAIAVWEFVRANNAERRSALEPIDTALEMIAHTAAPIEAFLANPQDGSHAARVRAQVTSRILDAMLAGGVRSARLALNLVAFKDTVDRLGSIPEGPREVLDYEVSELRDLHEKLLRLSTSVNILRRQA